MMPQLCAGSWGFLQMVGSYDNDYDMRICQISLQFFLGAIGISGSYFGKLTPTPVVFANVGCTGTEDGISNCSHSLLSNCPEHDAALVVCHCKEANTALD